MILYYFVIYFNWIKGDFLTSSATSFIMNFKLSLFECMTCCSSLSMERINLFGTANWIINVPDYFLLVYKNFLLLFHVQKIINISKFCILNCSIFFFFSKKISYTFNFVFYLLSIIIQYEKKLKKKKKILLYSLKKHSQILYLR